MEFWQRGVAKGDDKLNLTISFRVQGNSDLSADASFRINSNGEVESGNILNQDVVKFDIGESYFIIRPKKSDESDDAYSKYIEDEKKSNESKEYYIDETRLKAIYSGGIVNYTSYEKGKLSFKLDTSNIDKSKENINFDISVSLSNGTLVKNDKFTGKAKEDYVKLDKNLESAVCYFYANSSSVYDRELNNLKLPKFEMEGKNILEYLDKKDNPLYESKSDYNFNLVGYKIGSELVGKIAEVEYDLISLIGMDRFVFLKSFEKFNNLGQVDGKSISYPDSDKYLFKYTYDQVEDKMKLEIDKGKIEKSPMTDTEKALYEKFINQNNMSFSYKDDSGEVNVEDQLAILHQLRYEKIGFNIISEILRGVYNIELLEAKNDDIMGKLEKSKEEIDAELEVIKTKLSDLEVKVSLYEEDKSGDSLNLKMGLRSFSILDESLEDEVFRIPPVNFTERRASLEEYRANRLLKDLKLDGGTNLEGLKDAIVALSKALEEEKEASTNKMEAMYITSIQVQVLYS